MIDKPIFQPGQLVRLKSQPDSCGAVLSANESGPELQYLMLLDGKRRTFFALQLVADEQPVDATEKLSADQCRALLTARLTDQNFEHFDGAKLRHCISECDLDGEWPENHRFGIVPYSIRHELYLQLLQAVATHRVADRPDRFEPRKRKRNPRKADKITKLRWEFKRLMRNGVTKI